MRNTHDLRPNDLSDKELFKKFSKETEKLFKKNSFKLYVLPDHLGIAYEDGFLEVYFYDRPTNPRFENGLFKFDWLLANELRTISIKPVQ